MHRAKANPLTGVAPCLSRNRIWRNDRGSRRVRAEPRRGLATALAAAGAMAGGLVTGPLVAGPVGPGDGPAASRGREGAACGRAACGRADGGRSPDGASHASRRPRPSRIHDATQSRIGTSPGRARPNCTSSTSGRPKRTALVRRASFRPARPAARMRQRPGRPRREQSSWETIPPPWREIERACETCAVLRMTRLWTRRLNLR